MLLRQEGVSFQRVKAWKASKDPRYRGSEPTRRPSAAIRPAKSQG
jgi:hypothetical protein